MKAVLQVMEKVIVKIGNKKFKCQVAITQEEQKKGLQGVTELPKDEGMLFYFDPPQEAVFWMDQTPLPLDIIFINDDEEVTYIHKGEPNSKKKVSVLDTAYVLEVNTDSGIKVGDELEIEDESDDQDKYVMKVLAPDGSTQMRLQGNERIFSRINTKVLIRKAKKADKSKSDNDYKALGRYMFKCIKIQDERPPEYVPNPSK